MEPGGGGGGRAHASTTFYEGPTKSYSGRHVIQGFVTVREATWPSHLVQVQSK